MDDNEHSIEISLATTENIGGDDEIDSVDSGKEGPLAPNHNLRQPLSSSSDEDDAISDGTCSSDEEMEDAKEINAGEPHIDFHVTQSKRILVEKAVLHCFLEQMKINKKSMPIKISLANNMGRKLVTTSLAFNNSLGGTGTIGKTVLLMKIFGLDKKKNYRLNFHCLSTMGEESVYNFRFADDVPDSSCDAEEEVETAEETQVAQPSRVCKRPAWSNEAAKQPLISVQLLGSVPAFWDVKVTDVNKKIRLCGDRYKSFMNQVQCRYKSDIELFVEVETESGGRLYTSFSGVKGYCDGYFRNGSSLFKMAGILSGCILRMHYLGLRRLKDGAKVHCLRAEKLTIGIKKSGSGITRSSHSTLPDAMRRQQQEQKQQPTTALPSSNPSTLPDWVSQAVKEPLVSVQLAAGVPAMWAMRVKTGSGPVHLQRKGFKTFMAQLGSTKRYPRETLVELIHESFRNFFTSVLADTINPTGTFRRGGELRSLFGLADVDIILKARYLGYRLLKDGRKVHCFRTEKVLITPENAVEMNNLVDSKGNNKKTRKGIGRQLRSAIVPQKRDRETEREDEEGPSRSRLVAKKIAGPLSFPVGEGQKKVASLNTPSPFPLSAIPDWVKRAQHAQPVQFQQQQQGSAGPSGLQQQHQQQPPSQGGNLKVDLADMVADSLLARSDLDEQLVCRYLSVFGRLPKETREIDGKFILKLAAGPVVSRLKIFLEGALQQQQIKIE